MYRRTILSKYDELRHTYLTVLSIHERNETLKIWKLRYKKKEGNKKIYFSVKKLYDDKMLYETIGIIDTEQQKIL